MVKTEELSKQQLKSKETKDRIFQAAKTILRKKGYEGLSIKNICEEAGVSNGSFYHHLKQRMIFYLIILKNSQVSIPIVLSFLPTPKKPRRPLSMFI